MTNAVLGKGAALKLSDMGGTPVFTLIAEVLRFTGPAQTVSEVDVTSLDSTAREYIGGLPDGQNIEIECNWLTGNAQQIQLRDSIGSTVDFEAVWPDGDEAAFSLVLLGFDRGETMPDGQLKATISGRITGAITWTDAP